jgi:hypothetical protein
MTTLPEATRRHALMDEEQRLPTRADASTFRLQQQFMRAHGAPTGQLTTLITTSIEGGVFLCSDRRQQ